jgi:hypothetical protein
MRSSFPKRRLRSFAIPRVVIAAVLALAGAAGGQSAAGQAGFEGWDLESGVAQAHLVMVARVVRISAVTVVEGAKTDLSLREYRFEPVRVLKGLFNRGELSMTASDLGCAMTEGPLAPSLKDDEYRLLILAQSRGFSFNGGVQSYGCVTTSAQATTFDERVPLLTGPDDPLVAAVDTLIRVADSRSRRERATLLVDQLEKSSGIAAVPLLNSLARRADWAAADPRAYTALARLGQDAAPAVRHGAVAAVRDMLASGQTPRDVPGLDAMATALSLGLDSEEPRTQPRLAAIEALGYLQPLVPNVQWPRESLVGELAGAATRAERVAAATALSRGQGAAGGEAVLSALAALPLDETVERETEYARAAERLDAAGAARVTLTRLQRSAAADQSLEAEIDALGRMKSRSSLPTLLDVAVQSRTTLADRIHLALALGRLGDDRAAPVLAAGLQQEDYQLKNASLTALESIDSEAAARAVRPLLKSESFLPFKLRIARLLARHGIDDGYALATEHLSDDEHMVAAALVLAALNDPRTVKDLSAILEARPDRSWRVAALTGLAAVGDLGARAQVFEILGDDRHPLAASAAQAVGVAAHPIDLLAPTANLVGSRNRETSLAALLALRRALTGVRDAPTGLAAAEWYDAPDRDAEFETPTKIAAALPLPTRDEIRRAVENLAGDVYVDADWREQALAVARLLDGPSANEATAAAEQLLSGLGYAGLLAKLADQAELEGTRLLSKVQAERVRLGAMAAIRLGQLSFVE